MPEVLHEPEWVLRQGKPESLGDDLAIHERPARLQVQVRQQPAVLVQPGPCGLVGEADRLPLDQPAEELRRLLGEPLDGLVGVD